MSNVLLLFVVFGLFYTSPAYADMAQAREVARLNNCKPNKIEIYEQKMAADIQTVYKVGCTMPKIVGTTSQQMADALLIRCNGSLCNLMRPMKN